MTSKFSEHTTMASLDEKPASTDSPSSSTQEELLSALENMEVLPSILQEGILFAGSGSAILLQAAVPGIEKEDEDAYASTGPSSHLAEDLTQTLQATLGYIACLVFGTREEREALLARDNPPLKASETYAAAPHARLWVAATLYATATDFYQRVYGRVDYYTAQKAYAEFTVLMGCLGLAEGVWPKDRTAFWEYWDENVAKLQVTPGAQRVARDLMHRSDVPAWVKAAKPFLRVATIEMLPPRIRQGYGLRSTAGTRALYRVGMGFAVAVYPALPKKWRGWPLRYYLEELRRVLNGA